ncbi:hypothetical protein [Xenorhabdus bharatensis]|uniref:hypothetical protein n=1 Tax=Xenorhabdus bharatensis TaxID=3136256 RepID=UPI0030F460A1
MITVTLLCFSGRDNYVWHYNNISQIKKLMHIFYANIEGVNVKQSEGELGFDGFLVELTGPEQEVAQEYNLESTFYVCDGFAPSLEKSKAIGLNLLRGFKENAELREIIIQTIKEMKPKQAHISESNVPDEELDDEPDALFYSVQEDNKLHDTKFEDLVSIDYRSPIDGLPYPVQVALFNKSFWNNNSRRLVYDNCYSYACNYAIGAINKKRPRPGRYAGKTLKCNQSSVIEAALADGLVELDKYDYKHEAAHKPNYIVALLTTPDSPSGKCEGFWDYHWYRLIVGSSKRHPRIWGHKIGRQTARKRDQSGKIIRDICLADHFRYNQFGGYFVVNGDVKIK